MEAARVVPLRSPVGAATSVRVRGDTLLVERLHITDRALAAFVGQRPEDEQPDLVERALRIGLLALEDAGTSLDVDIVRREFDALVERSTNMNQRAAEALDQMLRQNFADQDGRLPRTLERFLGDRGQLNRLISELFDEGKRDSAIGRIRTLLGTYFDGDASRLALLLDPTRNGSPLYQFREEVEQGFAKLNERLTAIEAAATARASERSRSAAKGADFEDLLEHMLAGIVAGTGDAVDRTADATGDVIRSRKGDFLLTLDPQSCAGAEVRVVIEAKDRQLSWREIREELAEAKRNRGAAVALGVFTPAHAPSAVAPFDVRFGHVFCVIDPEDPDQATLNAALRLCRLHALASLADNSDRLDVARVAAAIAAVRMELDAVRRLKVQLTSIRNTASEVTVGLDRLRDQVLARVSDAEALLAPSGTPSG
jgi:hypothetical protein